jgi:surface antigen
VQGNSWLCYGWPSGAYHCTQRWSRVNWRYVSYNPSWVPSEGSAQTSVHATTYTVAYSAKPANTYPYGQCTFGAEQLAHDNVNGLGNARDWLWNAQRRGLPTGYTPRVGATVVFQPGVDGASWLGHVAHVVAVGSGGRFEIEAMNDAAGWGRYAFRWVQMRGGIAFIY